MIVINIASDYTKSPGGRLRSEGKYSGEDFREKMLKPQFFAAINNNEDLTVNLDGGYGYATSFLEEAFGGLARETNDPRVLKIKIVSDEEPYLVQKIHDYINDALKSESN